MSRNNNFFTSPSYEDEYPTSYFRSPSQHNTQDELMINENRHMMMENDEDDQTTMMLTSVNNHVGEEDDDEDVAFFAQNNNRTKNEEVHKEKEEIEKEEETDDANDETDEEEEEEEEEEEDTKQLTPRSWVPEQIPQQQERKSQEEEENFETSFVAASTGKKNLNNESGNEKNYYEIPEEKRSPSVRSPQTMETHHQHHHQNSISTSSPPAHQKILEEEKFHQEQCQKCQDLEALLQVSPTATFPELQQQWKELSKMYRTFEQTCQTILQRAQQLRSDCEDELNEPNEGNYYDAENGTEPHDQHEVILKSDIRAGQLELEPKRKERTTRIPQTTQVKKNATAIESLRRRATPTPNSTPVESANNSRSSSCHGGFKQVGSNNSRSNSECQQQHNQAPHFIALRKVLKK